MNILIVIEKQSLCAQNEVFFCLLEFETVSTVECLRVKVYCVEIQNVLMNDTQTPKWIFECELKEIDLLSIFPTS